MDEGTSVSVKLSIIIPTYNEEEYLPKLLYSIKEQDFKLNNLNVLSNIRPNRIFTADKNIIIKKLSVTQ